MVAAVVAALALAHAPAQVQVWTITYRAHNGAARNAYVALPAWYSPIDDPPLPLIISPHGRGVGGHTNVRVWGTLPATTPFAVVSPDGQGRRLERYSWGSPGQVDDLARMPQILRRAMPWLVIDPQQIFAVGGSMGGQETLLLAARHPGLLAGAAVFDAVTDFALQYRRFPQLLCSDPCRRRWNGPFGRSLQVLAREEVGGSPQRAPLAWAERSPITYARRLADSCVPLQLWWSVRDRIVRDQESQSGRLFREIRRDNPTAPVSAFVGSWPHSAEMRASARLPYALANFGLLPFWVDHAPNVQEVHAPPAAAGCVPSAATETAR